MRSSQESARRHSMSSTEDEFVRPHRGPLDDTSQGPRRIRIPRSKSASNMLEVYGDATATTEDDLRDIVREQVNRQALQELAEFLRTTGPRTSSAQNRHDECLRVHGGNGLGAKRWTFQTLKNRKARLERSLLQSLPENTTPGTTTQGNRYLAISVPEPDIMDGPWGRSQYPVYSADSSDFPRYPDRPSWPARISSRSALSPTSPTASSLPTILNKPYNFDVEQSSAKSSDLAELNKTLERALSLKEEDHMQDADASPLSGPVSPPAQDSDPDTGIISIRPRKMTSSLHSREKAASTASSRLRLPSHIDIEPPTINKDEFVLSSSLDRKPDLANFRIRSAVTPPCMVQPEMQAYPEVRLDIPEEPAAVSLKLHSRGLSAFPQASPPGSPPISRKSRPANITVGSSLMVPVENIQPDSPGFPMLLATMTFPSPPKSSPSHSPTSSISSAGHRPSSERSTRPKIHPRNSSLRSQRGQELSLDEIVMQTTPKSSPQSPASVSASDRIVMAPSLITSPLLPTAAEGLTAESSMSAATDVYASSSAGERAPMTCPLTDVISEKVEAFESLASSSQWQQTISMENDMESDTLSVASDAETFDLDVSGPKFSHRTTGQAFESIRLMSDSIEPGESQRPRSASSASTTKPERCESSVSFYTADESQRSSMKSTNLNSQEASRLSALTDDPCNLSGLAGSYRQSAATDDSYCQSGLSDGSFRQSARSDTTFATELSSAMHDSPSKGARTGRIASRVVLSTHEYPHISSRKGSIAQSFDSSMDMSSCTSERSVTPSSLHSTLNDEESHPRGLIERRKARKAKVREYKQKDLAIVRTSLQLPNPTAFNDTVDSPLLGWFAHNGVRAKRISSLALSPLSRDVADTTPSSTPETPSRKHKDPTGSAHHHNEALNKLESRSSQASLADMRDAEHAWTISPVMVLESTPAHLMSTRHKSKKSTERKNLTFSPLMVVVNVAGRTTTSKLASPLRPLSLLSSEPAPILPPRSVLRPKVKTQRPLPIKVARTSTSAMPELREEGAGPSGDSTIPTPPLSPKIHDSTRMSFPVPALPAPPDSSTADPHWDRVSLQRRREKHILQQKERQENAWLQAHQRERELEWRITAIKERLRREKIEKDKELADMVAAATDKHSSDKAIGPVEEDNEMNGSFGGGSRNNSIGHPSTEVEQRLNRLEQSGDAYLRIMVPLLENMNRTLTELRRDGIASNMNMGFTMGEFHANMSAEAQRLSLVESLSAIPARRSSTAATTSAFAAAAMGRSNRQSLPTHKRDRSGSKSSAGSQKLSARVEMNMSRPRSRRNTQTSARGESSGTNPKQSGESSRLSHETFCTGRSSSPDRQQQQQQHTASAKPLPSVPQSPRFSKELPTPPPSAVQSPVLAGANGAVGPAVRTPEDHQDEAFQAIQRRMEKQEAIFDQLMSGWATDSKNKSMQKKSSTRRPRSSTLPSRQAPLTEDEEDEAAVGCA